MDQHRKGRNCEQTDEMLESYRRRALRAEQQLIAARQALRGRIVHHGDTRPLDEVTLARLDEAQWALSHLSNGRNEAVETYSDPICGIRGVLLDSAV